MQYSYLKPIKRLKLRLHIGRKHYISKRKMNWLIKHQSFSKIKSSSEYVHLVLIIKPLCIEV